MVFYKDILWSKNLKGRRQRYRVSIKSLSEEIEKLETTVNILLDQLICKYGKSLLKKIKIFFKLSAFLLITTIVSSPAIVPIIS